MSSQDDDLKRAGAVRHVLRVNEIMAASIVGSQGAGLTRRTTVYNSGVLDDISAAVCHTNAEQLSTCHVPSSLPQRGNGLSRVDSAWFCAMAAEPRHSNLNLFGSLYHHFPTLV